jgi:hypothetical protein
MRSNPGLRIREYDVAGLVNETFINVRRMELKRNGALCTWATVKWKYLKDLEFVASEVKKTSLAKNKIAGSKETDIHRPSTGSGDHSRRPKKTSFPYGKRHRLNSRKRHISKCEILTSSPLKNKPEKKQATQVKNK